MLYNKIFIKLTFISVLLFAATTHLPAGSQDNATVKAMQLFDAGKFEEAETIFRQLLENDASDPLLNYYYGASRTENGHFADSDLEHLLKAGKDVTPDRINYYLAIQYHARNNWDEALKLYNRFRQSVPESDQIELGVAEKIQQCFDQVNPFENISKEPENQERSTDRDTYTEEEITADTAKDTDTDEMETDSNNEPEPEPEPETKTVAKKEPAQKQEVETDSLGLITRVSQQKGTRLDIPRTPISLLPGVKPTYTPLPGDSIEFQINNKIIYFNTAHFKTKEGLELYKKGQEMQEKLDSNLKKANELRKEYQTADDQEDKEAVGKEILSLEEESYAIKEKLPRFFLQSKARENEYWQNASTNELNEFLYQQEVIQAARRAEKEQAKKEAEQDITVLSTAPMELLGVPESQPSRRSGAQTDDLVYKIQIGAYSKGLPAYVQRLFNKLSVLRKIENYTDEDGVVVYTTGNLKNLDDAKKLQKQVRQEGVEDASVVPYFKGKRITLEQAKKIEAGDDIEGD